MDGTEQAPPTLLDRIRRRLELSYPWSHTDFRHDGTPVFTQMGNPVEDLRCVMQELDQTRQFESEIRALLLGGERDDPNQPTEILAENVSRLWKRATAELAQTRHLYANLTRCTVCDVLPGVKLSSGNADKCFRCDGTGFCTEKQAAAPLTILKLENELAQTRLRLDAMTGERAADEERLRQAGARVGIWYGCDTPDWLAEEILGLRARLDALEAEKMALADEYLEREYARAEGRLMANGYYPHLGICSAAHWKPLGEPGCICDRQFKRERNRAEKAEAQLTLAESSRASLEAEIAKYRDNRVSCTWGNLPEAARKIMGLEPHEWDNKTISEQRDYVVQRMLHVQREYQFELSLPPSSPSAQETP